MGGRGGRIEGRKKEEKKGGKARGKKEGDKIGGRERRKGRARRERGRREEQGGSTTKGCFSFTNSLGLLFGNHF